MSYKIHVSCYLIESSFTESDADAWILAGLHPVSDEGLRDPPRELSDVRFELHDDGIAYITLDR